MNKMNTLKTTLASALMATALVGCEQLSQPALPTLDLVIPNSLQGDAVAGRVSERTANVLTRGAQTLAGFEQRNGTGEPCTFRDVEDDDIFANGYNMTRFMVSAVATWTCVADTLIAIAEVVPHDGEIVATDNLKGNENYDPEEPTHYSVTDDNDSQTTIRLFYGYSAELPPTNYDQAGFFFSWNAFLDETTGKLVIDTAAFDHNVNDEDPAQMRLDFDFNDDRKIADMFLRFSDANEWAEGYRIKVTKDLTAPVTEQVFTAQGLLAMTSQFHTVKGIEDLPELSVYTVSNQLGDGAAVAEVNELLLPLQLTSDNHLGNYLTTKEDTYFFDIDGDWDYIAKTFTTATLENGRTTPATGGSWLPFDPSLDLIATELELSSSYFTGMECANEGDSCVELINAIFEDGFADQEQNQGEDPLDWRSSALMTPVYLDTVFPNGLNWDGAFDQVFYP